MSVPTVRVELGFGSTWQTEPASITWTNVTAYVLQSDGISTQRGAGSARGQVDVGSMGLSFKNADRRFDPTYTAGPYYGNLKPGVPVRVYCADDIYVPYYTESYGIPVWYGSVAKWPQRYDLGNRFAWVPLECFDGFDKLARAKIPRSPLEAKIVAASPKAYWPLSDTDDASLTDVSTNRFYGSWSAGSTALLGSLGALQGIAFDGEHYGYVADASVCIDAEQIEAVIDLDNASLTDSTKYTICELATGGVQFISGLTAWNTWFGIEVVSASAKTFRLRTSSLQSEVVTADGPMHVAVDAAAGTFYLNGSALTDTPATDVRGEAKPGAQFGRSMLYGNSRYMVGKVGHVAVFNTPISGSTLAERSSAATAPLDNQRTDERIAWVLDVLDWPTNLRGLETGDTRLGPATFKAGDGALDYLRLVNRSEDGRLFISADGDLRFLNRYWRYLNTLATVSQVTFSDQNTGRGFAEFQLDVDDELLVNVARYTRRDGTEQVATNASSVATYGEAEEQQGDLLLRTDTEVRSLAQWRVATQSVPLPRVPSIRIPLHKYAAADQATVLGLDLGHRVTCNRTPQGVGSAISTDFLVEGVRQEITSTEWWVTFYVSPVPSATTPVFVLGTSTLGGTHILGY